MPFEAEGDDIGALINEHRGAIPMAEHVVTMDPPVHTRTRGLLSRLITPMRLCENEDFMWRLSEQQLSQFVANGKSEFMDDYARPFAMLVIVDLLGVPAEYPAEFRAVFGGMIVGGLSDEETLAHNPLVYLDDKFSAYITDRRREPRPRSTMSSSCLPSYSLPARKRPRRCSARRCVSLVNGPTSRTRYAPAAARCSHSRIPAQVSTAGRQGLLP
jgi:cytochrome P450